MEQKRKVAFHTLGCKLNFSETSSISRLLSKDSFERVSFEDEADIYVINTCSVTANADAECRQIVRRALRNAPEARVVVIGCYAQLKPAAIAAMEGVDLVLGAKEKFSLSEHLGNLPPKKYPGEQGAWHSCNINEVVDFRSSYSLGERTRAFLKVQDGCDYSCTYCTIPLARGRSRSDTIAHTVAQVRELADQGVKEIVLTGVNLGDFGKSIPGSDERAEDFISLIRALDETEGIRRFRISSIEPNLLTEDVISFVSGSKRFMPHFHIPLQSGSDKVLKGMKRRYLSELYRQRVQQIRMLIPDACIGADVITGFPGEGEEEFNLTYQFLRDLEISYLHVFTYSERDKTEAITMKDPVPRRTRNERTQMLRILSEKKRHAFYEKHLGRVRPVLFESENDGENLRGYTDNYIRVEVTSANHLAGEIIPVLLDRQEGGVMKGVRRVTDD